MLHPKSDCNKDCLEKESTFLHLEEKLLERNSTFLELL